MEPGLLDFAKFEPHTIDEIVNGALDLGRTDLYCLYSSGQDSTAVADYISTKYPERFRGIIHSDTGVELPQTRDFVRDYCKERNWKLYITKPPKRRNFHKYKNIDFSYREFVLREGFPGPFNHKMIMGWLKFFGWGTFIAEKRKSQFGASLISGVRKQESFARMKQREYTKHEIRREGRMWFIKPFLYKTGDYVSKYFIKEGLKKSPSYAMGFDLSGDCFCGCFTEPWYRKLLKDNARELYDYILQLEEDVQKYGSKIAKQNPKWGQARPNKRLKKRKTKAQSLDIYCTESCVPSGLATQ